MRPAVFLAVLSILIANKALVMAQNIEFISSAAYSGPFFSVEVQGSYIYCLGSQSFQVFSINDSGAPALVGSCFLPNPNPMVIRGNYAYISGLRIVDVSNPSDPRLLTNFLTPGNSRGICLAGQYIYESNLNPNGALQIINISDPLNPNIISSYSGNYNDVCVSGDYAYLADQDNGLKIINISNPLSPILISIMDSLMLPINIVLKDTLVFASLYKSGQPYSIVSVDVSNLLEPRVLSAIQLPLHYTPRGLFISENYLYVPEAHGLYIIDITNPQSILPEGNYLDTADFQYHDVFVSGNTAYFGSVDLRILDLTDKANPYMRTQYDRAGYIYDVDVVDNYAYLANGRSALNVVDITDKINPTIVSYLYSGQIGFNVVIAGRYAFVDAASMLKVVNIENPVHPIEMGEYNGLESSVGTDIALDSSYLWDGYRILDISDTLNPTLLSFTQTPDPLAYVTDAATNGHYSYRTVEHWTPHWQGAWFEILDISNPSNPLIIKSAGLGYPTRAISTVGDYAYIAIGASLYIWDISIPDSAHQVSSIRLPYQAFISNIEIKERYAYLTECGNQVDYDGVIIIDISNPFNPIMVGSYETPSIAWDISVQDNYIFVADWNSLQILRFNPTGIETNNETQSSQISLYQNYPNPFNSSTTINYKLSNEADVKVEIFDIQGRKLATLFNGRQGLGLYKIDWNASGFSSGVYFCRVKAGLASNIIKIMLLR
jgi:hypothetical protein